MPHENKAYTYKAHWAQASGVDGELFVCGYCGSEVAPTLGWSTNEVPKSHIKICPRCNAPTFFSYRGGQYPGPLIGRAFRILPNDVNALYLEARASTAARAYTGAMMLCRKILMHVAVEKGILEEGEKTRNLSFLECVNWLIEQRYAPRGAENWVDYIRERGNEANHEIVVMTEKDAGPVIFFTEALLSGMYELEGLVPQLPTVEADMGSDE